MPARIVIVHDEPTFRDPLVASLRAGGHNVISFADASSAWGGLEAAERIENSEVSLTAVSFSIRTAGDGKRPGHSLRSCSDDPPLAKS
jgi:CheY-like chemotaxis protein